jgi:hypothetical protein
MKYYPPDMLKADENQYDRMIELFYCDFSTVLPTGKKGPQERSRARAALKVDQSPGSAVSSPVVNMQRQNRIYFHSIRLLFFYPTADVGGVCV